MPIHELMSMYGYPNNTRADTSEKRKNKKKKKKSSSKKSKDKKRKVNLICTKHFYTIILMLVFKCKFIYLFLEKAFAVI